MPYKENLETFSKLVGPVLFTLHAQNLPFYSKLTFSFHGFRSVDVLIQCCYNSFYKRASKTSLSSLKAESHGYTWWSFLQSILAFCVAKSCLAMFLLTGVSVAVCEILIILLAFIFIDLSFIIDKQNGTPTTTPATAVFWWLFWRQWYSQDSLIQSTKSCRFAVRYCSRHCLFGCKNYFTICFYMVCCFKNLFN